MTRGFWQLHLGSSTDCHWGCPPGGDRDNDLDVLELGVPFSDPLADGLTNQLAAQRALESGCCQDDVFRLVEKIRDFSDIPIVFYTYYKFSWSCDIGNWKIWKKTSFLRWKTRYKNYVASIIVLRSQNYWWSRSCSFQQWVKRKFRKKLCLQISSLK